MVTRHIRRGFTVIEVTLFLVISMLLLMSILGGLATRVHQQRYKDSVNDIADYLREVYSEVVYVENNHHNRNNRRTCYPGRSDCIVYGKLITFGEENSTVVHTYDVIGLTVDSFNAKFNVQDLKETGLAELNAVYTGAVTVEKSGTNCYFTPAGNTASHTPEWDAQLKNPDGTLFKGAVLIVRSPISNIIHTYVLKKNGQDNSDITLEIQDLIASSNLASSADGCVKTSVSSYYDSSSKNRFLSNFMKDNVSDYAFVKEQLDFCVDSDDLFASRRNVRFEPDGHDYTAVTLVPADGGDSKCR